MVYAICKKILSLLFIRELNFSLDVARKWSLVSVFLIINLDDTLTSYAIGTPDNCIVKSTFMGGYRVI